MATRREQTELWDAVSIIHNYYEDLLRPVANTFSITPGQLRALHTLHRFGALTVGELALASGMARANMSALCKKLTKQGFLLRDRGVYGDERQVLLELTPEGESAARQAESRFDCAKDELKELDLSGTLETLSTLSRSLSPQGAELDRLVRKRRRRAGVAGKVLRKAKNALFNEMTKKEYHHGKEPEQSPQAR